MPSRRQRQPKPERIPGPGDGSHGTVLDELIFDPASSGLLAEQTVLCPPRRFHQHAAGWSAYLLSGVVDSVSDVPPPSSVP